MISVALRYPAGVLSPQARALAANVRRLITEAPQSGRETARQLGYAHATVAAWCRGSSLPRAAHLERLVTVLAVPHQQRAGLHALRCAAESAGPDWAVAASAVLSGCQVPAGHAADVLDALARHCAGSVAWCATPVTAEDLRGIAATITQ